MDSTEDELIKTEEIAFITADQIKAEKTIEEEKEIFSSSNCCYEKVTVKSEADNLSNEALLIYGEHNYTLRSVGICFRHIQGERSLFKEFQCPKCSKRFRELRRLRVHLVIHANRKPYLCKHCPKRFNSTSNLHRHLRIHSGERPYVCNICQRTFNQSSSMNTHRNRHFMPKSTTQSQSRSSYSIVERPFRCDECRRRFQTVLLLESHNCIRPGNDTLYHCKDCTMTFPRKRSLMFHMRVMHGNVDESSLQTISSEEDVKKRLSKMPKTVTAAGLRIPSEDPTCPYKCGMCEQVFRDRISFCEHQSLVGCGRSFPCTICRRYFTSLLNLSIHMRTHTGERPYECSECSKAFTSAANFNRHMRVHSGQRPYTCDVCNKSFAQSTSLITHKRIHTGDRPFKCNECDKAFSDFSTLRRHRFVHNGERPFKCPVCTKSFICRSYLMRHEKSHEQSGKI